MPEIVAQEVIGNKIHVIRGKKVMLDRDLAELYGVETRSLNQAVRRNPQRFPDDFMFQLTGDELKNLKSQIVISSWGGKGRRWGLERQAERDRHRNLSRQRHTGRLQKNLYDEP